MSSKSRKLLIRGCGLPRVFLCAMVCAMVLLVAGGTSLAQSKQHAPYGLIFGTVWGPDNRAVQGVTVKIRRIQDKKPKWTLYSDARGEFAQRVPAEKADYVIWAEVKGHKGPAAETKIHVDYDERQDISLHLTE